MRKCGYAQSVFVIGMLCLLSLPTCSKKSEDNFERVSEKSKLSAEVRSVLKSFLASLVKKQDNVKARKAKELTWKEARELMGLNHFDALKTGQKSFGLIRYSDSTSIDLKEKTMVIILDRQLHALRERNEIALRTGRIDGTIDPSTERDVELTIKTKNGWIKVSNAQNKNEKSNQSDTGRFTANVTPSGKLRVANYTAKVEIKTDEETREVGRNEIVTIEPNLGQAKLELAKNLEEKSKEWESPDSIQIISNPPSIKKSQWKVSIAAADVTKRDAQIEDEVELEGKSESKSAPKERDASRTEGNDVPDDTFVISSPKKKDTVNIGKVVFVGMMGSKIKAFLNGTAVQVDKSKKFALTQTLNPGVNVFTFQVIGPKNSDIRYETFEITRK